MTGCIRDYLFQASVPMVSGDKCSAAYSGVNVEIGDNKVSEVISKMSDECPLCQVCAGVGGTDTYNGDSGGPLLADKLGNRSDTHMITLA